MSTFLAKPNEVERNWYVIDAAGKSLGRVAAQAATLLRGKNKATFTPNVDCGDHVIIINCKDSSYLANVATIELMARTKQLLSAASRYNGTGNVNVSDVFVLFGVAALIYFIIN